MKAARIIKTKEPLELKEVGTPKPRNDKNASVNMICGTVSVA